MTSLSQALRGELPSWKVLRAYALDLALMLFGVVVFDLFFRFYPRAEHLGDKLLACGIAAFGLWLIRVGARIEYRAKQDERLSEAVKSGRVKVTTTPKSA